MAPIIDGDQVKIEYIDKMGKMLGSLFYALWEDVVWLHAKWQEYRKLYGTKPERIDILNKSAPFFFRILQEILWKDTLLHISRLTDPIKSCGKSNLCLGQLEQVVPDETLRREIDNLITMSEKKAKFAHKWRNRQIAHHDLKLALERKVEPLPPVSRQDVEIVLEAIRNVMNRVEQHYRKSTNLYEPFIHSGDADTLLYYLRQALVSEEKRIVWE